MATLMERFNLVYEDLTDLTRIEVVRMFGPREATRTSVLRELVLRPYDILHFAGHCLYDRQDPPSSGWVFTGGERLSARELKRIDHIPKFVFSNACESGVTRERPELRSVDLAPSFAEAFFERGVSNFVCTAWPVDDEAARDFAVTLYASLLGIAPGPAAGPVSPGPASGRADPLPMYDAMREARLAAARTVNGAQTWGAYQHYGDPFFRLFDRRTLAPRPRRSGPRRGTARGKTRAKGSDHGGA